MRWSAAVPLLLAIALPAAALADRVGDDMTVARTTAPDGRAVELRAQATDTGGLCLDLLLGSTLRPDGACAAPPRTVADDLAPRVVRTPALLVVYGATTSRTRSLRLLLSSGASRTVRTVAVSPYAFNSRFYVTALRGRPAVGAVAALGAGKRVLAARDVNPMALPPLHGRVNLARLRDERGRPARLQVLDTRILGSSPTRRRRAICAGVRPSGATVALADRSLCVTSPTRVDIRFASDCKTGRSVFYGLVPSFVRRADLVLAGGGVRPMRVAAVPARLGHHSRAVSLSLASGTPRSIAVYARGGRRLATVGLTGRAC